MSDRFRQRLRTILLLTGLALLIYGGKLWFLHTAGSSLPTWDQWDAEGELLLRPWLEGKFQWSALFTPHNEHRPILTKLYALGLVLADGQWDGFVQTTTNAAIHALTALLLLLAARRWVKGGWLAAVGALLALLCALPFSWENTLFGFQSQFYFLLLFSFGHVWLTLSRGRCDALWFIGQLAGLATLGAMASGFLSSVAILAVLGWCAIRERRVTLHTVASCAVALVYSAIGWWQKTPVPGHEPLRAHGPGEFLSSLFHLLAWPGSAAFPWALVIAVPLVVFIGRSLARRTLTQSEALLLGLASWFGLQALATAFARGGPDGVVLSPRYFDLYAVGLLIAFITLLTQTAGRWRLGLAAGWFALVLAGLLDYSAAGWRDFVGPNIPRQYRQEDHVRAFLATGDTAHLLNHPWGEVPYPSGEALVERLSSPAMQGIMPAIVRRPVPIATASVGSLPDRLAGTATAPVSVSTWSLAARTAPFEWSSPMQSASTLPVLRFKIAGNLGGKGRALRLVVKSAAGAVDVVPDGEPGERWKTVSIVRPRGEWWIEASDADPRAWFAFTAPVELGYWSWFAEKLLKYHFTFLGTGLGLLALGGVLSLPRRWAPLSRRAAWSAAVPLLFGGALLTVLIVRTGALGALRWSRTTGEPAPGALHPISSISFTDPTRPDLPSSTFVGAAFRLANAPPREWYGTYVGGNAFTGRIFSTPFRIDAPRLVVPITGSPDTSGTQLIVEILDDELHIIHTFRYHGPNPDIETSIWDIPVEAWRGRLARLNVADGRSDHSGWLAVGMPELGESPGQGWLYHVPRNYAWYSLAALALVGCLFLPGLALRTWRPQWWPAGAAYLALPGLFALVAGGLAGWLWRSTAVDLLAGAALVGGILIAGALARDWWRRGGPLAAGEVRALGAYGCVAVGALAFGVLPLRVEQEFDGRNTFQARMIASPPDHAIPYRTATYLFHGYNGREQSDTYFNDNWSVTSRGPLAPLAIAAADRLFGEIPPDPPGNHLEAWPASGDAYYLARIVGILTNALVVLAGAALAAGLAGEAAGTVALVWLTAAPVIAINSDFLWPKLLATFFITLATLEIIARRPWWRIAGLAALAYYSHPLGGLMLPPLLAFLALQAWRGPEGSFSRAWRLVGWVSLGLAVALAPWFAYKFWLGRSDAFLRYPLGDGNGYLPAAGVTSWLRCRFENLWLTLVPGGFFFSGHMHSWIDGPLSEPLRWAITIAKTLPGELGFGAFFVSAFALARRPSTLAPGFRTSLIFGAFGLMVLFWGYSHDGLGRNCLEPLAVLLIAYTAARWSPTWRGWPWVLALAAFDTLYLRTAGIAGDREFGLDRLSAEPLTIGLICGLATVLPVTLYFFRPQLSTPQSRRALLAAAPKTRRWFLLAILVCGALHLALWLAPKFTPAAPSAAVNVTGTFVRDGQKNSAGKYAPPDLAWGSWAGNDANTGTLTFGPFPAPAHLRLGIGGFPSNYGNSIALELTDTHESFPLELSPIGERWKFIDVDLPASWRGHPAILIATDGSRDPNGWLALTPPLDPDFSLLRSLAAWSLNGLMLGALALAAARWLTDRAWLPPEWVALAAGGVVALAGFVAFWAWFAHPLLGRAFSVIVLVGGVIAALRRPRLDGAGDREWRTAFGLMFAIGLLYLAWLHLFAVPMDYYGLTANRFIESLPGDNALPYELATALARGERLIHIGTDWLTSDRPPLQTGWQLLTWPFTADLGAEPRTASGTAAMWFQLLWVPAAYGLLRTLRLPPRRAGAWTVVLALSGFFVLHTAFTWPKLSAAALLVGAFGLWIRPAPAQRRTCLLIGGALAGLAWLSHGGVAFSLLALGPWVAWRMIRGEWREWLLVGAVFLCFALPWSAYQKFHAPPANRLLKWHLGGQVEIDSRGTWQTIRENYHRLPWEKIWANKKENLSRQIRDTWSGVTGFSAAEALPRRLRQFFYTASALTWWLAGAGLLAVACARAASRNRLRPIWRLQAGVALWAVGTIVLWCFLIFEGGGAVVHQGSFAAMLALFVVLSAWAESAGTVWLLVIAGLQCATLVSTSLGTNEVIDTTPNPWALALAALPATALAIYVARSFFRERSARPIAKPGR